MNVFYAKPTLSYAKMVFPSFFEILKGVVMQNFPDATPPITSAVSAPAAS